MKFVKFLTRFAHVLCICICVCACLDLEVGIYFASISPSQEEPFDPSKYDAHSLGDVLKQWFRELPVPVIPFDHYTRFVDEFCK